MVQLVSKVKAAHADGGPGAVSEWQYTVIGQIRYAREKQNLLARSIK
jgi:hypothetical protein